MNLVFYSPNFYPLTGGLEHVVLDLALELSKKNHRVSIITLTKNDAPDDFPFQVFRCPGFLKQIKLIRRADVLVQFNVSLKGILPWLFAQRPLIVSHQTANTTDFRGRLKTWVANYLSTQNIGCSAFMAAQFNRAVVIPNPYNSDLFQNTIPNAQRTKAVIFVGRLVSDKGADLLLHALAELQKENLRPELTIVGQGPEEANLHKLTKQLGLEKQVAFAGLQRGQALVDLLNQHRIMVVPSIWQEPFGIVALEGLACGCWVIGSSGGGLPEAIGPGGQVFTNNDLASLVACLQTAITNPNICPADPEVVAAHLERHSREAIACAYEQVFQKAISN